MSDIANAHYADIAQANAEIDRLRALLPRPFYGTAKYYEWTNKVSERISGINFVIANRHGCNGKPMKLPPSASEQFFAGARTGARNYDVKLEE